MQPLDRSALAADLHQLQDCVPLVPGVIEVCRANECW
jgi:hypothetical protein